MKIHCPNLRFFRQTSLIGKVTLPGFLLITAAVLPEAALGQNRSFLPASGNFNDPLNWSGNVLPTAAAFIGNQLPGSNQTVTLDSSSHTLSTVYVGLNANGSATMNISNTGTLNIAGFYLGSNADAGGTVNQSGGTVSVSGEFRIVNTSTAASTYNLSGGTINLNLNTGNLVVGFGGGGVGTFNQSGGLLTSSTSAGMQINSGSFLLDSGGTNQLAGIINDGTIAFGNAALMTRSNAISGTGVVTKSGAGQLNLSGSNSYSGGTTIDAGTINMETTNALGSGSLTMNRGATLIVSTTGTVANAISLGSSGSGNHVIFRNNTNVTLSGNINSTAPSGSTFQLYGQTAAAASTLRFLNNTMSLGAEMFYTFTAGGGVTKATSDNNLFVFDGVDFSTSANFEQAGTKVQVLAGTTMDIGGQLRSPGNWSQFEMNGGAVTVAGGIDFTPGGVAASGLAFNGGTLTTPYIYGADFGSSSVNTLFNGTTVVAAANSSDFLRVRLDGNTNVLHGTSAKLGNSGLIMDTAGFDVTISNALADATGATGTLTKQGSGTLTLAATNTYTGATSVSAGTLFVTGGLASNVSVSDGATLGGGGTVGAVSFDGNSFFDIFLAIGGNPLDATTTISFSGTGFGIENLLSQGSPVDWTGIADGTYTLITGTLNTANLANLGAANAFDIDGPGGNRTAYFENGSLQLVVVPEPRAALLGGLGLLALLRRRR